MELPELWFIREDPDILYDLGEALVQDASLGVHNTRDLLQAEFDLRDTVVAGRWKPS